MSRTGKTQNETGTDLQVGIPYMPDDKFNLSPMEARERYGEEATPIPADEAWRAAINNFSDKRRKAEKWVLINYKANEGKGTVTFVNTFDGLAGSNFKQDVATFPLDMKKLRGKIGEHVKVSIDECPVACSPDDARKHKQDTERQAITDAAEATEEHERAVK